jgi:hypothetical protein
VQYNSIGVSVGSLTFNRRTHSWLTRPEVCVVWCQPAPPAAAAVDPALWRAELAEVRALRAVILAHIGPFMRSASMEVAERACHLAALLNLLALAESMEADQVQCPNPYPVILAHIGPFMRSASMGLAESMEADQVQCCLQVKSRTHVPIELIRVFCDPCTSQQILRKPIKGVKGFNGRFE